MKIISHILPKKVRSVLLEYSKNAHTTAYRKEKGIVIHKERIRINSILYPSISNPNPLHKIMASVYPQILQMIEDEKVVRTFGMPSKVWLKIWKFFLLSPLY